MERLRKIDRLLKWKFQYELDLLTEFGAEFGYCPKCKVMGVYEKEGPRLKDDADYYEVE